MGAAAAAAAAATPASSGVEYLVQANMDPDELADKAVCDVSNSRARVRALSAAFATLPDGLPPPAEVVARGDGEASGPLVKALWTALRAPQLWDGETIYGTVMCPGIAYFESCIAYE
jgi:hypothetical protein